MQHTWQEREKEMVVVRGQEVMLIALYVQNLLKYLS
jgi:hypothetical protein